ncbi:MAG: hypothetical protein AB9919_02105 [Geobacteraceae bacterium]
MFRWRRLLTLLPTLAALVVLLAGNTQAALLDIGPPVPIVVGSTPPNMGHGFPAWFRDSNRVPLQLCVEVVPGCLLLAADLPNPLAPPRFPDNLPGEVFYNSAEALIGNHLLFTGVEMNFVNNGDGTYEQVGFARVRIRIDSTVPGDYVVTTPFKQYFFTVTQAEIDATGGRRVINATEDIGLGANGDFTGILGGSIDPFVYSEGAPFNTATGIYLGDNTPRPLLGSKFTDPVTGQPANIFRIEGPPGFATVSTNLFAVTGKLYNLAPVPTPLTVDRVTYSRNAQGMQYSTFATTQALSNQTVPTATFPQNFALTGALSALQVAGTGIPTLPMTTNNPEDGKFFATSGVVADPGTLPATVTVTNTADVPITTKVSPLVDEIVISAAVYTPTTGVLRVAAASGDLVTPPELEMFFPDENVPAGILTNGQVSVTFPLTLGAKTYEVPPPFVIVVSSLGGTSTAAVQISMPGPVAPATGVLLTPGATSPQQVGTNVQFVAAASGGTGTYEYEFWLHDGTSWSTAQAFSANNSWTWNTTGLTPQVYTIQVNARSAGSTAAFEAFAVTTFQVTPVLTAATGVTLTASPASPQGVGTSVVFTAGGTGGSGTYEYEFWRHDGVAWTKVQPYTSVNTLVWNTTGAAAGGYTIQVNVRSAGSTASFEAVQAIGYSLTSASAAAGVTIVPDKTSPQPTDTIGGITFTATGQGGTGSYEYEFWLHNGVSWTKVQNMSTTNTWNWNTALATAGIYTLQVNARSLGSTAPFEAIQSTVFELQ